MSTVVADAGDAPPTGGGHAARRSTTPEKLRRSLLGDLDTIVAKALKKNPDERYASVAEFADDLRRYRRASADQRAARHAAPIAPPSSCAATAAASPWSPPRRCS